SFQNIIFFIVPITITYLFLSHPIIDVILRRGDFDVHSLKITSSVLFYYSFGLFFFCGIKLLVNTFYALKDTATPAKVTLASLIINIILSAALMYPLKIGGVALGSSLAAIFNFFLLYRLLLKKIGHVAWQDTRLQFLKVLLLSLTAAVSARFLWDFLVYDKYIKAFITAVLSSGIFIIGGYALGLKQVQYLKQFIFARKQLKP
ncbi:MAG: polysaccharide biosynthesis C-terminal domain-containing protein, partial [Candidatus Omnitrophica bacterium]|nr:polysaccharide biosynthesis C-terminal domain-containing protein [Candidatus Omnitrophota bacterium]